MIEDILNNKEIDISKLSLQDININKALVLQKLSILDIEKENIQDGIKSMSEQIDNSYNKSEEWRIRCRDALRHYKRNLKDVKLKIKRLNVYLQMFTQLIENWDGGKNENNKEAVLYEIIEIVDNVLKSQNKLIDSEIQIELKELISELNIIDPNWR